MGGLACRVRPASSLRVNRSAEVELRAMAPTTVQRWRRSLRFSQRAPGHIHVSAIGDTAGAEDLGDLEETHFGKVTVQRFGMICRSRSGQKRSARHLGTRVVLIVSGCLARTGPEPGRAIVPVPDEMSDLDTAQVIVNPITAWVLTMVEHRMRPGEWLTKTAAGIGRRTSDSAVGAVGGLSYHQHRTPPRPGRRDWQSGRPADRRAERRAPLTLLHTRKDRPSLWG